jgi:hypothetical protein
MTIAAQSNFQVVYSLSAAPGQCGNCGYSGSDRRYIDTHRDFEYYGALFYCESCVADMAGRFGWITPDKAAEKDALIDEQASELINLRARLAATEAYIGAALNLPGGAKYTFGANASNGVRVGDPIPEPTLSDAGGSNPKAAVTVVKSGPNDVRESESDDLADFDL